ncbi:MAG: hypothetical protein AAF682_14370 [Planctomycetota bacterium]
MSNGSPSPASLFFASLTLVAAPAAQSPANVIPPSQYQGPYAGQPAGLQLAGATFASLPAQTVRTAGIGTGTPRGWEASTFGAPGPDHPDYSAQALYAHWVPSLLGQTAGEWSPANPWQQPRLGGFSTGGDVTPAVDAGGRLLTGTPGNAAWYSLSFTVDPDAKGEPGSTVALASGNPGGWVFTYFDEGSQLIRSHLVNSIVVDYTRTQLAPQQTVSADTAITGFDWGLGVISSTPGGTPTPLVPNRDLLYFALDRAWVDTHYPGPGPWTFSGLTGLGPGAQPTQIPLDPGTVYAMAWNGAAWSAPAVAFDHVALYGGAQPNVAIDALSVFKRFPDAAHSPSTVVFSLEPESRVNGLQVDQILVTQRASFGSELVPVAAQTLRTSSGTDMSSKLGLLSASSSSTGPDDVDGLCGLDPYDLQSRDRYIGCPVDVLLGPETSDLGLSVARVSSPGEAQEGMEELFLAVTGIDLSGYVLGLLQLDLESAWVPVPEHPLHVASWTSSAAIPISAAASTQELRFPALTGGVGNNELRLRVRVHAVTAGSTVVTDHSTSWVTVIGDH